MAKRRPTIPSSHGDADDVRIALADQWQAIERVRAGDPDLRKVQEAISKGGPWRKDSQAKDWVGKPIAKTLNFDLDSKPDKEKVKGQIKAWLTSGALKEYEDEDDKRNKRTFVTVGQWAADDVRIAFTDEQWQAIERAYGRQLNAEMRQQIATVTTQYLKDCVFERTAAPKAMAWERIERIRRAAGDLEKVILDSKPLSASTDELSREQRQSGRSYADGLIRRHLAGSASSDELSSQQSDAHSYADGLIRRYLDEQSLARDNLHHFRDALKSLIVACDCALNDLSAAEYCDDEPWAWWIQGLTRIAQEHHLPYGARIVERIIERIVERSEPSPFVAMVRALQEHVPARHTLSCEALAKAIRRAQRRAGDK